MSAKSFIISDLRRIQCSMKKGPQSTTNQALKPGAIPEEVRKARRAERKCEVKASRARLQAEKRFGRATKALRDEVGR